MFPPPRPVPDLSTSYRDREEDARTGFAFARLSLSFSLALARTPVRHSHQHTHTQAARFCLHTATKNSFAATLLQCGVRASTQRALTRNCQRSLTHSCASTSSVRACEREHECREGSHSTYSGRAYSRLKSF